MENLDILSDKYERIIIETDDKKELLAEITNEGVISANNIQVRLKPKN